MVDVLNRFTGWVIRHKERIKTMGMGLIVYAAFNYAYNYGVFLYAFSRFGVLKGGALASGLALIINAALFWSYDRMKVDWLGTRIAEEFKTKKNANRFERFVLWIKKEKKTPWERTLAAGAFILLSANIDPLIVAVHLQQKHFKGLTRRDWTVLVLSAAIAIMWWLIRIGVAYSLWMRLFY